MDYSNVYFQNDPMRFNVLVISKMKIKKLKLKDYITINDTDKSFLSSVPKILCHILFLHCHSKNMGFIKILDSINTKFFFQYPG